MEQSKNFMYLFSTGTWFLSFQHDVSQTLLKATLDSVVEECVSFVGVDINICSEVLLRWDEKSVDEDHRILNLTGYPVRRRGHMCKVVKYRQSVCSYIASDRREGII